MNEDIKVGDRILVRKYGLFGGVFHAEVMVVKNGCLGKKYYCRWKVKSDFSGTYETAGVIRSWNIIAVN